MIATIVHVWVKPEFVSEFIAASEINHINSVKENGNLRFDVLQDAVDPCKFVLYEAYNSEQAAIEHKNTKHYALWRDTVAPMMAKPREGVKHAFVAPVI